MTESTDSLIARNLRGSSECTDANSVLTPSLSQSSRECFETALASETGIKVHLDMETKGCPKSTPQSQTKKGSEVHNRTKECYCRYIIIETYKHYSNTCEHYGNINEHYSNKLFELKNRIIARFLSIIISSLTIT